MAILENWGDLKTEKFCFLAVFFSNNISKVSWFLRFEFSTLKVYCFPVSPYHSFCSTSNISNWSAQFFFGLNPVYWVHPVVVQTVGREVAQVKLTCVELKVWAWAWRARLPGAGVKPWPRVKAGGGNLKQAFSLVNGSKYWILIGQTTDVSISSAMWRLSCKFNAVSEYWTSCVRFTHCSSTVQWPAGLGCGPGCK